MKTNRQIGQTKPNLPNQTYQTKPAKIFKPNLANKTYQNKTTEQISLSFP